MPCAIVGERSSAFRPEWISDLNEERLSGGSGKPRQVQFPHDLNARPSGLSRQRGQFVPSDNAAFTNDDDRGRACGGGCVGRADYDGDNKDRQDFPHCPLSEKAATSPSCPPAAARPQLEKNLDSLP